ncbi:MAG TPA: ABC transporter substrate-binding protein [Streptosporangiaceae bacterium]
MKLRSVLIAAIAAVAALSACSSAGSTPTAGTSGASAAIPVLRVGTPAIQNGTLDPLTTQGCATDYCGLFMERLLKFSPQNTLEPELATSVTHPDPVAYVYHLRHGVRFWDGSEMTSADVVYSLDYQEAPASETATYYTNVKSITAPDRYTVVVTLKTPNLGWPYTVAYEGVIFEKSFAEAHKGTMGKPGVLIEGTGPWQVDSFDPTRGIELSANPHWWGGTVPVRHISFKFFATESSEALAMRAGDIDVAFPIGGQAFAATSGARLVSWLNNEIGFFSMNVKLPPWNDIHVRRAVAYALNRADIIAAGGGPSYGVPIYAFYPPLDLETLVPQPQVNALLGSLPRYMFDLAQARHELAQSAYPHGFTATMHACTFGNFINQVQVVAAELQRIGINMGVKVISCDAWVTELYGPKTFGAVFSTSHSSSIDPSGLSAYNLGSAAIPAGGIDDANYNPPSVDQLLNAAVATANPAQRFTLYGQVLQHLAADVPYVPLFQTNAFAAVSSKFTLPPLGVDSFEVAWALNVRER